MRSLIERFEPRARRLVAVLTSPRALRIGHILLAVALVFAVLRFRDDWRRSGIGLADIGWPALVGAAVLAAGSIVAGAVIWLDVLRSLGATPRLRWLGIYLQAQVAKYLPGSVWQYAGRTALARAAGAPLRAVGVSLPIELVGALLGAAAWVPLLLGAWGLVVPAAVIAAAGLAARTGSIRAGAARTAVRALAWYTAAYPLVGVAFWLTARAVVGAPLGDLGVYVGAFGVAWLAGVVALYAPGGLGVREAVLVALLRGRLGVADALVLSAVSRAVFVVVDVALAAAGYAIGRSDDAGD